MTNYYINKDDLHRLLRAVGVLQDDERLMFVNSFDLTDPSEDHVVVSVVDDSDPKPPKGKIEDWTDEEMHNRFLQLAAFEVAINEQKNKLNEEFEALLNESDRRAESRMIFNIEEIPDAVKEHIELQVQEILRDTPGI
ncbi:MAG: hypothetical protein CL946_01170 [Ectothiorhodospiraceae bacterium]|nr:hypothetical protein [Ectothiorhodospiraceae bacterium]